MAHFSAKRRDSITCSNEDCVGCLFPDGDFCDGDVGDLYKNNCFRKDLEAKYGCMAWWQTDASAIRWKKLFEGDPKNPPNSQYYWAFSEQQISNEPSTTNPYSMNRDNWPNSDGAKKAINCISGGEEMIGKPECAGLIVTSKPPQVVCNDLGENYLLKFTITKIMT